MTMFNKVTKTFQWGQHTVTMETGEIARQASGARWYCVISYLIRSKHEHFQQSHQDLPMG